MNKASVAVALTMLTVVLGTATLSAGAPASHPKLRHAPRVTVELSSADRDANTTSALRANHVIYDHFRDVIYASIPGDQELPGNSVVPFFRDGSKGLPLYVGSEPNVMAISHDGHYLYIGIDGAGAIQRVDLETMTLDGPPWSLGLDPVKGIRVAADLVVLQDNPDAVAVARNAGGWPFHDGVAVYEDGVMRPGSTQAHTGSNVIEPSADPAQLFGYNRETSESGLRTLTVDDNGVNESQVYPGLIGWYSHDIHYADGRVFGSHGEVVDAVSLSPLGQFEVTNNSMPVIKGDRAFFIIYDTTLKLYELQVFDLDTLEYLGSAVIGALHDDGPPAKLEFIDAGAYSMALRTDGGEVFWLRYRLFSSSIYVPLLSSGG